MNEIIAWIATNNTLLIRIGFTAIALLMSVYVFRLLFVPKTSPEAPAAESTSGKEAAPAAAKPEDIKSPEAKPAEVKAEAPAPAAPTPQHLEEIERLKAEVQRLTSQVADAEIQMQSLKTAPADSATEAPADTAAVTAPSEDAGATDDTAAAAENSAAAQAQAAELLKKIEHLEARLAEYEIIAEDISEIGQLREENRDLKKRLGASDAAAEAAPAPEAEEIAVSEPESAFEAPAEVAESAETYVNPGEEKNSGDSAVSEAETSTAMEEPVPEENIAPEDEKPAVAATAAAEKPGEPSPVIQLKSEKEVTQTEKELIAQFEEDSDRKGS